MAAKLGKIGKQKNKSAAKKRIVARVTRTAKGKKWKYTAKKAGRNHLLMQKSRRQKKLADKPLVMADGDAKKVARLLPNL